MPPETEKALLNEATLSLIVGRVSESEFPYEESLFLYST